jgi:SAM-dependent methyltransferase
VSQRRVTNLFCNISCDVSYAQNHFTHTKPLYITTCGCYIRAKGQRGFTPVLMASALDEMLNLSIRTYVMHDTASKIAQKFFQLYWDANFEIVVELGSYDVNGSLRAVQPSNCKYVGLDLERGPSVDIVIENSRNLPLPDGYCDCAIASSVFEHDRAFWRSFLELCRITKPGGFIYINTPSNGDIHRYPEDCWRFYPDAGRGLEEWASSQSLEVTLIESFVANRMSDQWNDFVAVFQRGAIIPKADRGFLSDHFKCANIHRFDKAEIENPEERTEDRLLLDAALEDAKKTVSNPIGPENRDDISRQLGQLSEMLSKVNHLQHFLGATLDREFPVVRGMLAKFEQSVSAGLLENTRLAVSVDECRVKLSVTERELAIERARLGDMANLAATKQTDYEDLKRTYLFGQIENGKLLGQVAALNAQLQFQTQELHDLGRIQAQLVSAVAELNSLKQQREGHGMGFFRRLFMGGRVP